MMSGKEKIKFKCTIKSVNKEDPLYEDEDIIEENHVLLGLFEVKMRNKYGLAGDINFHRSKKGTTKGVLIPGRKIVGHELTVTKDETIFVLFDETITVVPGGAGTGANVAAKAGKPVLAYGGFGQGGAIDSEDNGIGGAGQGGDGYGEDVIGNAGEGYGAIAVPAAPGRVAQAGAGVGGKLTRKAPDVFAHTP